MPFDSGIVQEVFEVFEFSEEERILILYFFARGPGLWKWSSSVLQIGYLMSLVLVEYAYDYALKCIQNYNTSIIKRLKGFVVMVVVRNCLKTIH